MNYSICCSEDSINETKRFYELLGFECRIVEKDTENILLIMENEKICQRNGIFELPYIENLDKIITWSVIKDKTTNDTALSTAKNIQTGKWSGSGSSSILSEPRHLSKDEKTSFLTDILTIHDPNKNEIRITHSYSNFKPPSSTHQLVNDGGIHPMKCKIGVLTSGGDSPGMNTCLGTILKLGKKYGIEIVCFRDGFFGLVTNQVFEIEQSETIFETPDELEEGLEITRSNKITTADRLSMNYNFIVSPETFDFNTAGTLIGTARCLEYRTDDGFKAAIRTIMKHNLSGIVIMGGDGSMRGGNVLSEGYYEIAKEILETEKTRYDRATGGKSIFETNNIPESIKVVHIPFSIDNDIPSAYTIGTDTALQTIADSSVILNSTFSAHNRLYVMEVMGRDSSYLSTVSGVAFADYVIYDTKCLERNQYGCSERDWISSLMIKVSTCHKKCFAVVLSENAHLCRTHHRDLVYRLVKDGVLTRSQAGFCPTVLDQKTCQFERIKPEYIKCLVSPYIESRDLTLGHLQRGCKPVAYDRIISVISGIEAVNEILHSYNHNRMIHTDPTQDKNMNINHDIETSKTMIDQNSRPISIILNHNNLLKRDLSDLLHRIDNNVKETGIKDLIERVIRFDINMKGCAGQDLKHFIPIISQNKEKKILFLVHSYPIPGINMLINKIYQKLSNSKIKCYAAKNGFNGLLSHGICEVEDAYNEETDCVFGYSFHDTSGGNEETNSSDLTGREIQNSPYSQEELKKMSKILGKFDKVVVIGEQDAIQFIEENIEAGDAQQKIIIIPFSKYIHSVPGSYSVLSHTVNLIDSIRNTYNKRIDVKLSDESLALMAGLAVGGKCINTDATQPHVIEQPERNQKNENISNKEANLHPNSQNGVRDSDKNKPHIHIRNLVKEAEICTFSERPLFRDNGKKQELPPRTEKSITLDLTLLESPNRLYGWDRALVVIYSVFCAELLLHELQNEKMVIFEHYHNLLRTSKNNDHQSQLQILLITEHPRILSKDQFYRWIKLEKRKYLVYRKIIDIIEGHA